MDNDFLQKVELVDNNIGDLARSLAGDNKNLEEKLKQEIKEIILQKDLKSSSQETATLIKALTEENAEETTETIVRAKEVSLTLNKWTEENIEAVRVYRGEYFKNNLVEETRNINPNITEEQLNSVRSLADNFNRIYNTDGGIENQKEFILEEYGNESPGKIKNAWLDLRGNFGLLKQKPQELDKLIDNHEKITNDLQEVNLPYQGNEELASYDRVMNSIKNPEMRRFLDSSRARFKTLDRISNGKFGQISNNFVNKISAGRFKNVANNFINKSIIKTSNGFASKIGNQAARDFVQKSMATLLKNGVSSGMKSIMQGAMKKGAQVAGKAAMNVAAKMGLKAATFGLKAAFGAATAGVGYVIMAGWEALKLGGKLIGKLIGTLGMELTNNKFADTTIFIVLFLIVLLFGMNTATANIVSSLVPEIETKDGVSHGEITYTTDGRLRDCGVGMEADFRRNVNKTMVTPEILASTVQSYNSQLEETVGDQSGKRCGVVYAAHFLAYDFDYWVPYWFAGRFAQKGINPRWGAQLPPDENNKKRKGNGLDCGHFRTWAWINGGFPGGTPGNSNVISFNGDCEKIKSEIEPGDGLFINKVEEGTYSHSAIVLAYDENTIKFAHSGGGSGVSTGLINICNGKGIDNGMTFDSLQKKIYNNSDL